MRIECGNQNMDNSIRECFASDPALLEQWHIEAPSTLDNCVHRTMTDIETTFNLPSFKFYRAYDGDTLVGYWGTEFGRYINLIFVKPEYRKAAFMKKFWTALESSVSTHFHAAVYSKNVPAIEFYRKRGRKIKEFSSDGHKVTVFEFNRK